MYAVKIVDIFDLVIPIYLVLNAKNNILIQDYLISNVLIYE